MKFKQGFLGLFSIVIMAGFSQSPKLDSLQNLVDNYANKDKVRISYLVDISNYHYKKDIDKAEPYMKEAIAIAESLEDYQTVSELKTRMADNYVSRGLFKEALSEILQAARIQDSIDVSLKDKIFTQNILSTVYRGYGDNQKSLDVILKVIELSKKIPLSSETVKYYYNAGGSYAQLKDLDNAEICYLKAKEIANKIGDKHMEIIMTSVLGDHYKNISKYKEAKQMITKSLDYYKANNEDRNLASSYRILGDIESLQGNTKESIPCYENALEIFDRTGNLYYSKMTNQRLFIAYSIVKEREKANMANNRYNTLKDSLDTKERKSLIAEMNVKFDIEKVKKQKEIANLQSNKNKNMFIGSTIFAVLILLSSLLYIGRLRAHKKAELITAELKETQKRLALEKQYRDSELKALKSQMNPHFVFNALNSIQDYIVLNKKDLASDYLGKFADLIRNYLHFSDTGFISVSDEVHNLKLYLELEKLRFEDEFQYHLKVDSTINTEVVKIPTMLIQPYIENALKHGLFHKKDDRSLDINFFKLSDKVLQCVIKDNGIGREKSNAINAKRKEVQKAFALKATAERLDLLNYGKERKIGVNIIDLREDGKALGTKVILNIPILT
ncbi:MULTISPECIES: histidine kinase [unclassified Winogradskyella]|uniref:histidine kinase n=1 Tax=unclassified Winogradskyella TaxID=2615021 RepID=UPI0018E00184|nr:MULTISPECIES: histidine kinase [unclassified Winogradskyella]